MSDEPRERKKEERECGAQPPAPGLPFANDGSFFAAFLAKQAAAAAPAAPVVVAAEAAPAVAVKPAVILKRSAPLVVVRPQAAGEAAPTASDASKRLKLAASSGLASHYAEEMAKSRALSGEKEGGTANSFRKA